MDSLTPRSVDARADDAGKDRLHRKVPSQNWTEERRAAQRARYLKRRGFRYAREDFNAYCDIDPDFGEMF